jgi:hypothetical protein
MQNASRPYFIKLRYLNHDTHTGRESRDISNPAKIREKMRGKMINRFASSPFLTPALMKNARDTAQILISITIRRKMKNFAAST